jgi:hypothetical protein
VFIGVHSWLDCKNKPNFTYLCVLRELGGKLKKRTQFGVESAI